MHVKGKNTDNRYLALRFNLDGPPDSRTFAGRLTCRIQPACKGGEMRFGPFLILGLLLLLAWVGGFVVYHSAGFLIHVLLVLAVISVIVHFFTGTRTSGA